MQTIKVITHQRNLCLMMQTLSAPKDHDDKMWLKIKQETSTEEADEENNDENDDNNKNVRH